MPFGLIWAAILECHKREEPHDLAGVAAEMERRGQLSALNALPGAEKETGPSRLEKLLEVAVSPANAWHYATKVIEKGRHLDSRELALVQRLKNGSNGSNGSGLAPVTVAVDGVRQVRGRYELDLPRGSRP